MYFLYWFLAWVFGFLPDVDRRRFNHFFGWSTPKMRKQWGRVWNDLTHGRVFKLLHSIENLSTEWARQDAQRAQKYYRSWIHVLVGIIVYLVLI